ncbi:alpha/beta fold hydrolase [Gordonia sp. ABSL49_1]|uniref:alpha/beta fold hydrolase n=1 Tax=Gordonia sp. ABSL49_1 TaxID=2920941 RepID=UPI001F116E70|nr:alpha/beta hydrolase [Gordonia sp. ABSL49_1]MCH5645643.1 alpha/beta hydrolase [Gordonia sp. ABSL49_1]
MSQVHVGDRIDGGEYVSVGGQVIWHFHDGDRHGAPTVLLHGAFAAASTWGAQIAGLLADGMQVYVPERSGHGHSPDTAGLYSFAALVDQTIEYLDGVVGAPAHLVGWADGAVVALLVARERPDLVNRMVLFGNYVDGRGRDDDEFLERVRSRRPDIVEFLRTDYDTMSPDGPSHFPVVFDKLVQWLGDEPDFDVERFSEVTAPTLVIAADRGVVSLEHSLKLARTLPNGRLAILPGTHILPVEAPELFNPLVSSFLTADPPAVWRP